jgi:hypothetical protein
MRYALVALAAAVAAHAFADEDCYGTRVNFVATPKEAAVKAKDREKLVFVLHVSGHFEDPRFT